MVLLEAMTGYNLCADFQQKSGEQRADEQKLRAALHDRVESVLSGEPLSKRFPALLPTVRRLLSTDPAKRLNAADALSDCDSALDVKRLKLDLSADSVLPFADVLRAEIPKQFASVTGTAAYRFPVLAFRPGCVELSFRILPPLDALAADSVAAPSAAAVWADLQRQWRQRSSALQRSWIGRAGILDVSNAPIASGRLALSRVSRLAALLFSLSHPCTVSKHVRSARSMDMRSHVHFWRSL
jgi:hypothetical protein